MSPLDLLEWSGASLIAVVVLVLDVIGIGMVVAEIRGWFKKV